MLTATSMKFMALCTVAALSASDAFVPTARAPRPFMTKLSETSTAPSDFASAMPQAQSPYERFGAPQENLAIGVDVNQVLQWIGTREDMIEIFRKDNPSFSRDRAEEEVDRFLMDAEMMNGWMKYLETKERNPELIEQALNQNRSFMDQLSDFTPWILGYLVFTSVNKNFIQPKFDSGEWDPIDFGALFGGGADSAGVAISTTVDAASGSM